MRIYVIFIFLIFTNNINAQAQVGINTKEPKATLDIEKTTDKPDGIIAPRLSLQELISRDNLSNKRIQS